MNNEKKNDCKKELNTANLLLTQEVDVEVLCPRCGLKLDRPGTRSCFWPLTCLEQFSKCPIICVSCRHTFQIDANKKLTHFIEK